MPDTLVDGHDSYYWGKKLEEAKSDKPHSPLPLLAGLGILALAIILHLAAHIIFVWLYIIGGLCVLAGIYSLFSKGTDPAPIQAKHDEALRREQAARNTQTQ